MTAPRRMLMAAAGAVAAPYPSIASEHSRWRADQGITEDVGVTQWDDISLIGDGDNDFVQTTDAEEPSYSASGGPAGDGSITFDGSNDDMLVASGMASIDVSWHFFLLLKNIAQTGADVQMGMTGPQAMMRTNPSGTDQIAQDLSGGTYANQVTATDGTFFLLDSYYLEGSTDSFQRLNNGSPVTGESPGTSGASTGLRIGAEWNGANNANIELCELILFDALVTGADLTALMAYFSDRYGLF